MILTASEQIELLRGKLTLKAWQDSALAKQNKVSFEQKRDWLNDQRSMQTKRMIAAGQGHVTNFELNEGVGEEADLYRLISLTHVRLYRQTRVAVLRKAFEFAWLQSQGLW